VQSTIFRKAGRHTRQVAPLWKATYGPLDCSIHLDAITSQADIDTLLSRDPHRFHHVTSLWVSVDPPDGAEYQPIPPGVISTLPPAFPRLQSLEFANTYFGTVSAADLQPLVALSSCLTSLALPSVADVLPAIAVLLRLTALRSLSLDWDFEGVYSDKFDAAEGMRELSRLPHLQQLQYPRVLGTFCPAAELLRTLRTMDLTDLGLYLYLYNWDEGAIGALRTALPRLTALTLITDFRFDHGSYQQDPSSSCAVMAALAQRTALRSLTLELDGHPPERYHLGSLSALRLAELYLTAGGEHMESLHVLLEAVAVQRTLTSLAINEDQWSGAAMLSGAGLRSLAALAPGLQRLALYAVADEAALFGVLGAMSRLTALKLLHPLDGGGYDEGAVGQLSRLSSLEQLHVRFEASHLMRAALRSMAALTSVNHLDMQCTNPGATEHPAAGFDADHAWGVVSLRRSLTYLSLQVADITGPSLCGILGRMTALQHLVLRSMEVLSDPELHEYLLPLPPALRVLRLWPSNLAPGVRAALQAAAERQGCALHAG
jgi:hypothetical protein